MRFYFRTIQNHYLAKYVNFLIHVCYIIIYNCIFFRYKIQLVSCTLGFLDMGKAHFMVFAVVASASKFWGGEGEQNSGKMGTKHPKISYSCHFYAEIVKFGLI